MVPFLRLVLAVSPLALESLAVKQVLVDHLSLLQAEVEKAKGSTKHTELVEFKEQRDKESFCRQLADGALSDGSTEGLCSYFAEETTEVLPTAIPKEPTQKPQVWREQPATLPATAGGTTLGYILDFLVLGLVLDGIRRWRKKRQSEPNETDSWDTLMQAALAGDAKRFEALLSKAMTIAGADLWGCTLLHAASKGGSVPVVQKLLAQGASVNELDSWDDTPLHIAARVGHAEICELLLAHGAAIDVVNAQDWTPLVVAADAGHEAMCCMLLGRGAGVADLQEAAMPPLLTSLLTQCSPQEQDHHLTAHTEEFQHLSEEHSWSRMSFWVHEENCDETS
mmetsp:Transcript_123275/g.343232  ORF Transcript_123275/g.343232 Transcript_123275/m.343232 type:complete len:338 (-) Transcript_123275:273-1286(-)|eukprot:CAMPEP_0179113690 /NCGR_PEP_ID=MMETSP0796-20121207/53202_1 /TAXON_ID=73915 /ORGANISM="Pyrodinium bahamense, Strain pbaha01" /LENGTH=337 /DNA_ID=CAMNT_0020811893 /DNA_START=108 /DNA_END=1121 /DNA_ORIENTATION=-